MRLAGEPADLVQTAAKLSVTNANTKKSVIGDEEASLFDRLLLLESGNYQIRMTAAVAYLITFALETKALADREQEAVKNFANQGTCLNLNSNYDPNQPGNFNLLTQPPLDKPVWDLRMPRVYFRQTFVDRVIASMKVKITQPSLLHFEAGTNFLIDHASFAIQIPEGLMQAEQRGSASNLEVELPPGEYTVELQQRPDATAVASLGLQDHCGVFSANLWLVPLSAKSLSSALKSISSGSSGNQNLFNAGGAGPQGIAAEAVVEEQTEETDVGECEDPQAVPLPLDFGVGGGSEKMGGPIDPNTGQLLLRSRIAVTDIHDGRKKVFLPSPTGLPASTGESKLLMKVELQHLSRDDREDVQFDVSFPGPNKKYDPKNHVQPAALYPTTTGFAAYYVFDVRNSPGLWLSFHHSRPRACMLFDLVIETRDQGDIARMTQCGGDKVVDAGAIFPNFGTTPGGALQLPFKYESGPIRVREGKGPRQPTKASFSLPQDAWIVFEIQHNFMLSHQQAVLHEDDDPVFDTDLYLKGSSSDAMTVKKWFALTLSAGTKSWSIEYTNELWADSFSILRQWTGNIDACVPMSLSITLVPIPNDPSHGSAYASIASGSSNSNMMTAGGAGGEAPSILSVVPNGDYPLCAVCGALEVRVRFSRPLEMPSVNAADAGEAPFLLAGVPPTILGTQQTDNLRWGDMEEGGSVWALTFMLPDGYPAPMKSYHLTLGTSPILANVIIWDQNGNLPIYRADPNASPSRAPGSPATPPLWAGGPITPALANANGQAAPVTLMSSAVTQQRNNIASIKTNAMPSPAVQQQQPQAKPVELAQASMPNPVAQQQEPGLVGGWGVPQNPGTTAGATSSSGTPANVAPDPQPVRGSAQDLPPRPPPKEVPNPNSKYVPPAWDVDGKAQQQSGSSTSGGGAFSSRVPQFASRGMPGTPAGGSGSTNAQQAQPAATSVGGDEGPSDPFAAKGSTPRRGRSRLISRNWGAGFNTGADGANGDASSTFSSSAGANNKKPLTKKQLCEGDFSSTSSILAAFYYPLSFLSPYSLNEKTEQCEFLPYSYVQFLASSDAIPFYLQLCGACIVLYLLLFGYRRWRMALRHKDLEEEDESVFRPHVLRREAEMEEFL
ncbi:unnamed protein product [Amoebophrya sp. A25]|nr:unnamed protein product [Amoebophrya sp. A25]|eukprot:GSA25T00012214001.1